MRHQKMTDTLQEKLNYGPVITIKMSTGPSVSSPNAV